MSLKNRVIEILLSIGCVKFGEFILSSGIKSNVYVDLRRIISYPREFKEIALISSEFLRNLEFDVIAGVESSGIPLATSLSLFLSKPLIYVRKESKNHGLKKMIEGEYSQGQKILVVDDVSTTGSSIIKAVETLRSNGLRVSEAFVIVDRGEGAVERLREIDVNLKYIVTLEELLGKLKERGETSSLEVRGVCNGST